MYAEGHTVKGAKRLPLNLLDALRALREVDGAAARRFGEEFSAPISSSRHDDWNAYSRHL